MKKRLIALLLVLPLLLGTAFAWGNKADKTYAKAKQKLTEQLYADAAELFDSVSDYEDASLLAMYCRAKDAAGQGQYAQAAGGMKALGDFLDAPQLANYYTALNYESNLQFEEAASILMDLALFMDSSQRLLSYPDKINARDYAAAERLESAGQLEDALSAFKALGSYSDSAARAAAVQAKINARDYDRADSAEEKGDYAAAYEGFLALGSYSDSHDRAAALKERALYAKACAAADSGDFDQAHTLFEQLGDYEDSAAKAYVTSVVDFAKLVDKGDGIAAFSFHDVLGLINVPENVIVSPQWDAIGAVNAYGLMGVRLDGQSWYDRKYGYINTLGQVVVDCVWDEIGDYADGLVVVGRDGLYGLCDAQGNVVTETQWKWIAALVDDEYYDEYGREKMLLAISEDRIAVCNKDGLWGFIDTQGNVIGDVRWQSVEQYSEGLALVCDENGRYGYVDLDGAIAIEPQYSDALSFSEGLAAVKKGHYWQYIDSADSVVIEPQYTQAMSFEKGRADVYKANEGWQIIDKTGGLVYFANVGLYQQAEALMESGEYAAASEIFRDMRGYQDADSKLEECIAGIQEADYQAALALKESGEYAEAYAQFEKLDGYKDAAEQMDACTAAIQEADYQAALALMESGSYAEAYEQFAKLDGYKDAAEQMDACIAGIKEADYQEAVTLMESGEYKAARAILEGMPGYRDADSRLEECLKALGPEYKKGDIVMMGTYGGEAIEWLVLDVSGSQYTMSSLKGLEVMPFNETTGTNIWENCTARAWLNDTFYQEAFTDDERRVIVPGATGDNVWLLSADEAMQYFASNDQRACGATEYARQNNALISAATQTCRWWLRSPGEYPTMAMRVESNGQVNMTGNLVNYGGVCIRPVIVINYQQ